MITRLHAHADSHPGMVYDINEDSVFAHVRPSDQGHPVGLFIVADGVGGHKAGEVASQMAVDTIRSFLDEFLSDDSKIRQNFFRQPLVKPIKAKLRLAIEAANRAIYNFSKSNPSKAGGLGSTVACGLVYGNTAIIANVGDSRTYHLQNENLKQISEDHSYVSALVRKGLEPPEAYYDHPHRNVITRSLGSDAFVEVDTWTIDLEPGDRLLFCSDGLWEMIASEEKLAHLLNPEFQIQESVNSLIEVANQNGGTDNIGVVIAEVLAGPEN